MTEISIITGNVGAGKSTYAARLSAERRAHVFAIDEWMRSLFQADMSDPPPDYEWMLERTRRCDRRIMAEALRLADLGVPAILDLGFFTREQRDWARDAIKAGGHVPALHILDVDAAERWARIEARNARPRAAHEVAVSRETFDFCETIYEAPTDDERVGAVIVD
ncbi:MAG: ATP-binding protein [Pseudomonadota bacterium]